MCLKTLGLPVCLTVVSLVAPGCSKSKYETIPVSGQIRVAGRELPKDCYVYFVPTATGEGVPTRPSAATVAADGTYTVKSFKDSEGLLPGTYEVRVAYYELKPGGNAKDDSAWAQRLHPAGELVVAADSEDITHDIDLP